MAIKRTVKSEATTDGVDGEAVVGTDRVGTGSPSFRTRILQPRFKCVAHYKQSMRRRAC